MYLKLLYINSVSDFFFIKNYISIIYIKIKYIVINIKHSYNKVVKY